MGAGRRLVASPSPRVTEKEREHCVGQSRRRSISRSTRSPSTPSRPRTGRVRPTRSSPSWSSSTRRSSASFPISRSRVYARASSGDATASRPICRRRWRSSRPRPRISTDSSSGSRSTTGDVPSSWKRCAAFSGEGVRHQDLSEADIAAHLYAPELPDPDLVIRTSGEQRISNFLLWQSAYAELVFDDTLWPDFGEEQLRSALEEYASRARRFGAR